MPKFSTSPHTFHADLKKRINSYFDQTGKSDDGKFCPLPESSRTWDQFYRIIHSPGIFYAAGFNCACWNVFYSDV